MFFDFNLASDTPGWADSTVQIRDAVLKMTASDLTDALGELLQALMLLVNGSSRASCEWTREPGGWRWDLKRASAQPVSQSESETSDKQGSETVCNLAVLSGEGGSLFARPGDAASTA